MLSVNDYLIQPPAKEVLKAKELKLGRVPLLLVGNTTKAEGPCPFILQQPRRRRRAFGGVFSSYFNRVVAIYYDTRQAC
jgi:hypothetical protein